MTAGKGKYKAMKKALGSKTRSAIYYDEAEKKPMQPLREIANLIPVVGVIATASLFMQSIRELWNVTIIKRFKLWSRYEIWIVRRKEK